jgi:hypothetical protein
MMRSEIREMRGKLATAAAVPVLFLSLFPSLSVEGSNVVCVWVRERERERNSVRERERDRERESESVREKERERERMRRVHW